MKQLVITTIAAALLVAGIAVLPVGAFAALSMAYPSAEAEYVDDAGV